MEAYQPIIAIIMYLTSLLGPNIPDEVTVAGDGLTLQLVREEENIWTLKDNKELMVGSRDGFLVEKINPENPKVYTQKIIDHVHLPVNLEGGQIKLKQSPMSIEFERHENHIDFTILRGAERYSEISVIWKSKNE